MHAAAHPRLSGLPCCTADGRVDGGEEEGVEGRAAVGVDGAYLDRPYGAAET